MSTPRFDPDATPTPDTPRTEIIADADCVGDLGERIKEMMRDPGHSLHFEMLTDEQQAALAAESKRVFQAAGDLWYRLTTLTTAASSEPPF